mgnify:CR=1 FL=1
MFLSSFFFGLFNLLRNTNIIIGILLSVLSFFTAIISIYNPKEFNSSFKYLLITLQIILALFIFIFGFDDFPRISPLEKVIDGSSANGVTTVISLIQATYFISSYFLKKKMNLILPVTTVLICFAGYGRGSILLALAVFLLTILVKCIDENYYKKPVIVISFFLISFYFINENIDSITYFFAANSKLERSLVDTSREEMLGDYFNKLENNFTYIIFGTDYKNTSIVNKYRNNPHNSFIRAHSFFGFLYLLIHFIFIMFFFRKIKSLLDFIIIIIFCFFVFMRIFTEVAFMATSMDFIMYYIIFLGIFRSEKIIAQSY